MTESHENEPQLPQHSDLDSNSAQENKFLSDLLGNLAEQSPDAREALLKSDPGFSELVGGGEDVRQRMRAALTGGADVTMTPQHEQLREEYRTSLAQHRREAAFDPAHRGGAEPPGVLTSLMRELPPAKAMELFRKIAPAFIYQILDRLNRDASISVIHQLADHLCDEGVLGHLRTCEHVRDGILEEFRNVLGQSEVCESISRADLDRLLHESGAIHDLIAMENCIKLSAKAG